MTPSSQQKRTLLKTSLLGYFRKNHILFNKEHTTHGQHLTKIPKAGFRFQESEHFESESKVRIAEGIMGRK